MLKHQINGTVVNIINWLIEIFFFKIYFIILFEGTELEFWKDFEQKILWPLGKFGIWKEYCLVITYSVLEKMLSALHIFSFHHYNSLMRYIYSQNKVRNQGSIS